MSGEVLNVPLRIVFYKEDGLWIAHCLEFDLIGDGKTKDEAMECLAESIRIQTEVSLEHGNPSNLFTPASGEFQRKFFAGRKTGENAVRGLFKLELNNLHIAEAESREYTDGEHVYA